MIKMAVFDIDNTLYDYDRCNALAEQKLGSIISSQLKLSSNEALDMLKQAKKNIKLQLGDVAASHNRLLYMQNICEQAGVKPGLYAMAFYNAYWDTMLEYMEPFPYVRPLFEQLKGSGIRIGVLTDLTAHIQYRKLDKLNLLKDIDMIVTSEEAGAEKPSAKMFDLIIRKAELRPREMLMIGDSKEKDVDGASKAGMLAIHFSSSITVEKQFWEMVQETGTH